MNIIPKLASIIEPLLRVKPVTFMRHEARRFHKNHQNGFILTKTISKHSAALEHHWACQRETVSHNINEIYLDAWRRMDDDVILDAEQLNDFIKWNCGPLQVLAAQYSAEITFNENINHKSLTHEAMQEAAQAAVGTVYSLYGREGIELVANTLSAISSDETPFWFDVGTSAIPKAELSAITRQAFHIKKLHDNWNHSDSSVLAEYECERGIVQYIAPTNNGNHTGGTEKKDSLFELKADQDPVYQFVINKQGRRILIGEGINKRPVSEINLPVGDSWPISAQAIIAECEIINGWILPLTSLAYSKRKDAMGTTKLYFVEDSEYARCLDSLHAIHPLSETENQTEKPKRLKHYFCDFHTGRGMPLFDKAVTDSINVSVDDISDDYFDDLPF